MMMRHFLRQPGGRLASIFAVLLCAMSAVMGSYVYSACQKASADYTTLVSDIVLAQQATPQLRAALEEGSRQPSSEHIKYIDYFISLSKQHLNNIQSSIERHRYLISDVEYLHNHFSELNNRLSDLTQQSQQAQQRPELIDPLQRVAMEVGGAQAWLYNQLLEEVRDTSVQQRLVMQRLSIAVSALLVLMVSAAITLCLAVIHLHRQRNVMHQLMLTDELTGLYNRRHLVNIASAALTQAQRDRAPLSLLLLDLDHFKQINDTYGHPTGDEVLRQISKQLRELSRPSDTLARIGGEEFCLLMPNTATHDALQVADRLRREVEVNTLSGIEQQANPTISIGVTTCQVGSLTFEQLYSFADKALYQAKALGRNRVEKLLPPTEPSPDNKPQAYGHTLIRESSDS
ncbi:MULTISPECIES: GGDEF domain-containing protein [Halomonadaceae]|jgi:diguanylate cyclase|uniref:diguanylate cyclase n=1 Tax=Vreelandella titanicae TaxID=664683 RepID=A0A653THN3_9GAMM|nr:MULTISPECIES: GGDEF domain-containing protein [Halomonas]UEQ02187.1 GGDEF domain-containing protein [Halomonas profundus]QKS23825.1 Response regulator PleD [Halomonas titanicae]CAD5253374.1 Response regulator PleD [Halomonas sp. I3]CAD5255509.1 Response regulator PleD [Halomonas sp. 156]CAD5293557.1 Response regulator PleD [Halomonas sp. 113]|tara:strand:+ start:310 stop:1515 length:1206 start_codon:yes stop_codon:yes gene_type:complete